MNISKIATSLALGLLLPIAAHAAPAVNYLCGDPTGGSSGGEALDSGYLGQITNATSGAGTVTAGSTVYNVTSCNVLITFGPGGAITTSNPNTTGYYDVGGDDNSVGILNMSGGSLGSVSLSSSTEDIFGFDGDGICGYTFSGSGPNCGANNGNGNAYLPSGMTLSNLGLSCGDVDRCGTVSFGTAIANNGSAFFSLEDPVDLNHLVVNNGTPEPNSLILLGTGLVGLVGVGRRKIAGLGK